MDSPINDQCYEAGNLLFIQHPEFEVNGFSKLASQEYIKFFGFFHASGSKVYNGVRVNVSIILFPRILEAPANGNQKLDLKQANRINNLYKVLNLNKLNPVFPMFIEIIQDENLYGIVVKRESNRKYYSEFGRISIKPDCIKLAKYKKPCGLSSVILDGKTKIHPVISSIFSQIVHGLQTLTLQGYLHRNINPKSIYIAESEKVMFLDLRYTSKRDSITETKIFSRSFAIYTAPELQDDFLQNNADFDFVACDIWSMGVILYELLFNRKPFYHDSMNISKTGNVIDTTRWYKNLSRSSLQFPIETPVDLQEFLKGMLQIDPSKRTRLECIVESDFVLKQVEFLNHNECFALSEDIDRTMTSVEKDCFLETGVLNESSSSSVALDATDVGDVYSKSVQGLEDPISNASSEESDATLNVKVDQKSWFKMKFKKFKTPRFKDLIKNLYDIQRQVLIVPFWI